MARTILRRGSASAGRLVDTPAPQHGVDEPHQLPGRQNERAAMLVARRLAKLLVVVGTELRTREPNRVGGLDHMVAQIGVAGLAQRTLLSFELPRLVAPPGQSTELRQRFLALESAHVPDLGDDAGREDRTQTWDGGERLRRCRPKLGGDGLLDGLQLGRKGPYGGQGGAQDEVDRLDHRSGEPVGAPGRLEHDLRHLLGVGDPASGAFLDEGGQLLYGGGRYLVGGEVAFQKLLGSRPEGVRERPLDPIPLRPRAASV